jgi:hypothetical protein
MITLCLVLLRDFMSTRLSGAYPVVPRHQVLASGGCEASRRDLIRSALIEHARALADGVAATRSAANLGLEDCSSSAERIAGE